MESITVPEIFELSPPAEEAAAPAAADCEVPSEVGTDEAAAVEQPSGQGQRTRRFWSRSELHQRRPREMKRVTKWVLCLALLFFIVALIVAIVVSAYY